MPIRFTSAQRLFANADTAPAGLTQFSFQFWIKLVAVSPWVNKTIVGKEFTDPFTVYTVSSNSTSNTLRTIIWGASSHQFLRDHVIQLGQVYHYAVTYNNGAVRYYLNGKLTQAQGGPAGAIRLGPSHRWSIGGGGTIDLDDVCVWKNYTLSAAEVLQLRNRTLAPLDLAPDNHMLCWSLDGTAGVEVQLSHSGVKTANGDQRNASVKEGTPVYVDTEMTYVPPAVVKRIYIGESGKTLIAEVEGNSGAAATVSSIASHPTIVHNGGEPVSLSPPGGLPYRDYVIYPLPFTVDPSDTLTYSAAEGWLLTSLGDVAAATDAAIDATTAGQPMLPREGAPLTMALGQNLQPALYFSAVPVYANRILQSNIQFSFWGGQSTAYTRGPDGELLTLADPNRLFTIVATSPASYVLRNPDDNNTDKKCYNMAPGQYRLMWDGADELALAGEGTANSSAVTQSSYTRTQALDNTRVYNNTVRTTDFGSAMYLTFHGADVRNVRLWGPEIPDGWTSRFHPEFLRIAADWKVLRFMDGMATNQSNYTYMSRFLPQTYFSFGGVRVLRSMSVTRIDPYTASPANYFLTGRTAFTITTSSPHNLVTGECIRFGTLSGAIQCTDGSSFTVPSGHISHVRVLSPTTFAAAYFTTTSKTPQTNQTITGSVHLDLNPTYPLQDIVDLSEECDADPWICVPHAMPDDQVTLMAAFFAEQIAPGRKLYVEYSNECWNLANGFRHSEYVAGETRVAGLSSEAHWYAKRAGEVQAIFTQEFAARGRPATDLVRVYGSWFTNPAWTQSGLAYAQANQIPFDAVATAPYFHNQPVTNTAAWNAMDVDQIMDVGAKCTPNFGKTQHEQHKAYINTHMPNARLICYEGGMERGVNIGSSTNSMGARSRAWSRHPRMRDQLWRFLTDMQSYGIDLFTYFELNLFPVSPDTRGGYTWGVYPTAWNMPDGLGDGSDGKNDNRQDYDDLDAIVSVMGYTLRDWNVTLAAATSSSPVGEPEDSSVVVVPPEDSSESGPDVILPPASTGRVTMVNTRANEVFYGTIGTHGRTIPAGQDVDLSTPELLGALYDERTRTQLVTDLASGDLMVVPGPHVSVQDRVTGRTVYLLANGGTVVTTRPQPEEDSSTTEESPEGPGL